MAGQFLDKLAPETRTKIYEYVLSFDTPLKHVTNMQPFVQKLTGSENEAKADSQPNTTTDSLQRINTSILTTNKLIYVEAIAVFYASNTICFDPDFCESRKVVAPHATDLSLATQVVTRTELPEDYASETEIGFSKAMKVALVSFSVFFPKLRAGSMYYYTDPISNPPAALLAIAQGLRNSDTFETAEFDAVGSVTASFKHRPQFKLVLQCREAMRRWADPIAQLPLGPVYPENVSARALYQSSRADLQNSHAQYAYRRFDLWNKLNETREVAAIDGFEYWTIVDTLLAIIQRAEASRA